MPDFIPQQATPITQETIASKPKEHRWKKILHSISLVILSLIVLVNGLIIVFPGAQTIFIYKTHAHKSKFPQLYTSPIKRQVDKSTNLVAGDKITWDNLEILTPWKGIEKKIDKDNFLAYTFGKTKSIILSNIPSDLINKDLPPSSTNQGELANFKRLYGNEIMSSNYSFYKAILETNLDKISVFTPGMEGKAKSLLITYKLTMIPNIFPGTIYSFQTDNIKGFQLGDPRFGNAAVLDFFDKRDHAYEIVLLKATQEEVDFVLSNIKVLK